MSVKNLIKVANYFNLKYRLDKRGSENPDFLDQQAEPKDFDLLDQQGEEYPDLSKLGEQNQEFFRLRDVIKKNLRFGSDPNPNGKEEDPHGYLKYLIREGNKTAEYCANLEIIAENILHESMVNNLSKFKYLKREFEKKYIEKYKDALNFKEGLNSEIKEVAEKNGIPIMERKNY